MTIVTIVTGPRYGSDATDKYPGLNPCMFHGYAPKVEDEEKKKGSRYVKTGWASAYCEECRRQDPDRIVYAYNVDLIKKWNKFNPVFDTEEDRKSAVLAQLWKERDEAAQQLAKARAEVERLSELVQFKEGLIYLI